ncbi:MAG: PepSY domain-containing protein [Clostridia bacterium]|nr:PepSY domain-containing protein [Clostridia bacterium]
MKKLLVALLITALVAIGLASCGQNPANNSGTALSKSSQTDPTELSLEQAQAVALQDANLEKADFAKNILDSQTKTPHYNLIFVAEGQKYEYEIAVQDGRILESEQEKVDTTGSNPDYIGSASAQKAALQAFGLTEGIFTHISLDWDDGQHIYEIEFYANGTQYEVEVEATSGNILSSSSEVEQD